MQICDVCKDSTNVKHITVTIDAPVATNCYKEIKIDLCEKCIEYANPMSLIIGMQEIRHYSVLEKNTIN